MTRRTTQTIIAAMPSAIAVCLVGMACAAPFGIVVPGEKGYKPIHVPDDYDIAKLDEIVIRQYGTRAPTEWEREAALNGSVFGWDVPGADPEYLEANPPRKTA